MSARGGLARLLRSVKGAVRAQTTRLKKQETGTISRAARWREWRGGEEVQGCAYQMPRWLHFARAHNAKLSCAPQM